MHDDSLERWQHDHDFLLSSEQGERRTTYVLVLTAVTMVAEITAGTLFGSMALLADGWHMSTHVAAFLIAIYAYRYARRHADNPEYAFGTGKVSVLGGFASAVALGVVALMMLSESLHRLVSPMEIQFNAALAVAGVGLVVNLVSALLLKDEHAHGHHHPHDHDHHAHAHEHHHDHNLHAAYMHVLADALTSLLAIVALLCGKYFGLNWLDPVMGIVGAVIIARWSLGLLKQSGPILLDSSIDADYRTAIRRTLEDDSDNRVTDLHIWKVSAHHYAAIISLVTNDPKPADYYKELLRGYHRLSHVTLEVNAESHAGEMPA